MIKRKQDILKPEKIELDLTGPDGNAFVLLGYAQTLAKQTEQDWATIQRRMTSGDYENLVSVFDEYFGDFVILYR